MYIDFSDFYNKNFIIYNKLIKNNTKLIKFILLFIF